MASNIDIENKHSILKFGMAVNSAKRNAGSLKALIRDQLKPTSVERIDEIERLIVNNYISYYESFEDYIKWKEPQRKRIMMTWFQDIFLGIFIILFCLPIFHDNDPYWWLIIGMPIFPIPNLSVLILTFLLFTIFGFASRLIIILMENKHKFEYVDILYALRNDENKAHLANKYYLKMSFLVQLVGNTVMKIFYLAELIIIIYQLTTVFYCYLYPEIPFSWIQVLVIPLYSLGVWSILSAIYTEFTLFYLTVTYLRYRFEQVNEKIKSCKKLSQLKLAIEEHNSICEINHRNNYYMKFALFMIYYLSSLIFDLFLIQATYLDTHWIFKIFFLVASSYAAAILFVLYSITASLREVAHRSYRQLNSIMAKSSVDNLPSGLKPIPIDLKIKTINLIERMAQTEITAWCLDLFPLNSYEFYSFVAGVSANFLLLIGFIR